MSKYKAIREVVNDLKKLKKLPTEDKKFEESLKTRMNEIDSTIDYGVYPIQEHDIPKLIKHYTKHARKLECKGLEDSINALNAQLRDLRKKYTNGSREDHKHLSEEKKNQYNTVMRLTAVSLKQLRDHLTAYVKGREPYPSSMDFNQAKTKFKKDIRESISPVINSEEVKKHRGDNIISSIQEGFRKIFARINITLESFSTKTYNTAAKISKHSIFANKDESVEEKGSRHTPSR